MLKIHQIPSKRYKYYITKKGFIEKARLTQEYFSFSFNLYREATEELLSIFEVLDKDKISNIVLSDISEIADIAILASVDCKLKIVAVIGGKKTDKFYKKIPIISNLSECKDYDYILITTLFNSEVRVKELSKNIKLKPFLIPSFLKFTSKSKKL